MTAVSNPADDAATEALIARLIAEDFGENVDSLRIGGSIEDYEDPLTSYERGVIEGTISDTPSWGDPVSNTSGSDPCAGTDIPEYTGEAWDDTMAWEETSTNEYDNGMGRQGLCEDDTNHLLDTNCYVMDQTSIAPTVGLASSVYNSDTTNAIHPATYSQRDSSNVFSRPLIPPMSDPTLPDTVPIPPVPGSQRDTDTSRLRSQSDPSPLQLDRASSLRQATVPNSQVQVPGRFPSEFSASKPFLPVKLTKDEAISQATVGPKPTQCHPSYNPAEYFVPRLSAADRYAGLDIDYSSSKGKARARAFDGIKVHTDDDGGDQDQSAEFERQMRNFERKFCESGDSLDDWLDSEGNDSSLIHIPFPGSVFGRDEQEISRLEDLAVVDIHVGEEETLESILNDICNPSDQKARVRLEASVSRAILSTTDTQASGDTTSVEASSTLGTQGSTDSTSFGPSTSSGRSRGNEPPMRSLRQERRRAYYRDKKGWNPKKNDPELLFGVQVRGDDEILSKMPKDGEENKEEDKEEVEPSRGRKRKSKVKKRKGKGKEKQEGADNEDEEASEGRSLESDGLLLTDVPADKAQAIEGEGSP